MMMKTTKFNCMLVKIKEIKSKFFFAIMKESLCPLRFKKSIKGRWIGLILFN